MTEEKVVAARAERTVVTSARRLRCTTTVPRDRKTDGRAVHTRHVTVTTGETGVGNMQRAGTADSRWILGVEGR